MNYYNPYFYTIPTSLPTQKVGLLSKIFGKSGITLSGILNGTQKALNFANQAIPLVKQVKPMFVNAKTMFKVMNEFKKTEKPKEIIKKEDNLINPEIVENDLIINNEEKNINQNTNGPTFFI